VWVLPIGGVAVETLLALPRWVYVGVVVGVLMSVGVAATFAVAARLFPAGGSGGREDRRNRRRSTEERRRAEIRSYLDAIDERYQEDAAVAEERVAFYLPERDVAVTFDARTFLALERGPTHAILAEHEMPGVALRNRLPFETPGGHSADGRDRRNERRSGPSRRPTPTPDEAAYAVLGLPEGASEDAVRRAYRERVKEVHPDQGGDEEEFRRVRKAYDAARRQAR